MRKDKTNDWIYLHGLRLKCHIGVSLRERRQKQTVTAGIALKCDLSRAGKSDCLEDTVDYAAVVKTVVAVTEKKSFCLLESLARRITEICLADSKVKEATVNVAKKRILSNVSSVAVEITRKRRNRP